MMSTIDHEAGFAGPYTQPLYCQADDGVCTHPGSSGVVHTPPPVDHL